MTTHALPRRARPPGRGFAELVKAETKLAWRTPLGLVLGVAVPVFFLVLLGSLNGLKKPAPAPSTLTLFAQYVPVLICMSLALIALISLPIPLVTDRQMGVLRRFSTTPAPPSWLLAAQVIINLTLALTATVIMVAGSALFFGVSWPSQAAGFALSAALAAVALFSVGLLIAALAATPQIAGVTGTVLFYPLLFLAGLYTPTANMAPLLQRIGDYTPVKSAVQAMLAAMQGTFPSARPLLVMAGWAAVCGIAAIKLFRWE